MSKSLFHQLDYVILLLDSVSFFVSVSCMLKVLRCYSDDPLVITQSSYEQLECEKSG